MTVRRAWRERNLTAGSGGYIAWSRMEIRTSVGGADVSSLGTPICDSNYPGLPASNGFDGNINTLWACNGTGIGSWLGVDFGATVGNWQDAAQFLLATRNDGSWIQNSPDVAFDYNDTPSNPLTWVESFRITGSTFSGANEAHTYVPPPPPPAALEVSLLNLSAWVEPVLGFPVSKAELAAWIEPNDVRVSLMELSAWLDRPNRRMSLM